MTGAPVAIGDGTASNGCVLLIFTAGAGFGDSGRVLMRAVSFRGPVCGAEPG